MDTERWRRIDELFHAALERGLPERDALLAERCGDDIPLRAEVASLLTAHEHASSFIESPAFDVSPRPAAHAEAKIERGRRMGAYTIRGVLGRGGMGIVYEAVQVSLNRKVALKVLSRGLGLTTSAVVRFHREAQAAAKLHHTNIVAVYDEGEDHGTCYYAMELIEGQGLDAFIRDRAGAAGEQARAPDTTVTAYPGATRTPTSEPHGSRSGTAGSTTGRDYFDMVARWIADAADALAYAHDNGVIHRDIKPSNLMVASDGRVKVMDFGLARMLEEPGMTISGEFLGTPRYMSPEQIAAGRMKLDHRTDIYSLGVTLYELLTLRPPFEGESRDEVIGQIVMKEPTRPRRLDKQVPTDLETICLKAMEKDVDRRYPTANQMADDLRRYLNRFAIAAKRVGPLGRFARFVRRNKMPVAACAALMAMAAIAGVVTHKYRQGRRQYAAEQTERLRLERMAQAERHFYRAQQFHAEGRYQEALEQAQRALEGDGTRPEARLLHARMLFERDRGNEAITALERFLGEGPTAAYAGAAHLLLATIYRDTDQDRVREHQQRAEALLPDTADAYYLRALTAGNLEDTVRWLDDALSRDRAHYPSLKSRALAHYTRGDYANMAQDADRCITLRQQDASGWSLRAVALREMGQWDEALKHHDQAVALDRDDVESYVLRRDTHRRMGNHEEALTDARRSAALAPNDAIHRFEIFLALVRLGRFEAARQEHVAIKAYGPRERTWFKSWLNKRVFDALAADEPLELPDSDGPDDPIGLMRETRAYYRALGAKGARRLVAEGMRATWSPDADEIAYSAGTDDFRVLEIMDLQTGDVRILAVAGRGPMWSPDGKFIAFVRAAKDQPVRDLTQEGVPPLRPVDRGEMEVWLATADGREMRRLVRGGSPSWGRSSEHLYFHGHQDPMLYRVSTAQPAGAPSPILPCPGLAPLVSPDERYVACADGRRLWIHDLSNGSLVARWEAPDFIGLVSWSPTAREVCVSGYGTTPTGMWVFDLNKGAAWKVVDGPVARGFWSRDGSRIAFDIRWPGVPSEIWVADLDPKVPTTQALGPAQSVEQHVAGRLAGLAQAIEANPDDFDAYLARADLYTAQKRWRDAIADYTEAIRTRPPINIRPYRMRAEAYVQLNAYEQAGHDYARYAELLLAGSYPYPARYNNMAWFYVTGPTQLRNAEKALPLAQKAVAMDDSLAHLHTLGVVFYRLGRYDEAVKTLTQCVTRSGGGTALDFFYLAMCYQRLGQAERAREEYDKAVKWCREEARKPLRPDWERQLAAFRAEAEALFANTANRDARSRPAAPPAN